MRHILLALVFLLAAAVSAPAAEKTFSQFAVDLPDGWTSDERPGFQSGHPDEYMLLLGKRGEEAVEAHISIFILPNKDGMDARTFASRMREMQDAPTELQQEGTMWTFRGTPRSRALAMETLTRVSADDARILIIMEQDPAGLGTARVVDSLRGLTPASKALLGEPLKENQVNLTQLDSSNTQTNPMQQDKNHILKKEEILSKDIEKRVDIYQDTVDSLLLE